MEEVYRFQIQSAADFHISVQLAAARYHEPHCRYDRLLISLRLFLRKLHLLCDLAHIHAAAFEIIYRYRSNGFLNGFALRTVFLVDDRRHICGKAIVQLPERGNLLADCLCNIEQVTALAVLTEHSNAMLTTVHPSAELVPDLQCCDFGRMGILLIDQRSIGKTLLIHSR